MSKNLKIYCQKCGKRLEVSNAYGSFDRKTGDQVITPLYSCPGGSETEGHDCLEESTVEQLLA
jgi:hypothetical protein